MQQLSINPNIREIQIKLREYAAQKAENRSYSKPVLQQINYATIPIEDLKALEQTASEWLSKNKGSENYDAAHKRYKKITHFIAVRT